MIVAKAVGIELAQLDGVGHTVFAMPLRRGLISHQMLRNSEHPVRHDKAGHVFSRPSDHDSPFCNGQCAAEVANSREENVQTGKKLQLMVPVLEGFRKRYSTLDCGANLVTVSFGEHRRYRQSLLENHLPSDPAAGGVEPGQRPLAPA